VSSSVAEAAPVAQAINRQSCNDPRGNDLNMLGQLRHERSEVGELSAAIARHVDVGHRAGGVAAITHRRKEGGIVITTGRYRY
jgi:hypothetical protein